MKNLIKISLSIIVLVLMTISCKQNTNIEITKSNEAKTVKPKIEKVNNSLTAEEIAGGRMTPEILWKFGKLSDAQLSPDGVTIVYSVSRTDSKTNVKNTSLFIIPSEGGEPKDLTGDLQTKYNQRWTPDGKRIGYLSTETGSVQLFEINIDGTGKKQISFCKKSINSFEYAPDGKHILGTFDVKLDKSTKDIYPDLPLSNAKAFNNLMYRHWNDWTDYKYSHVFVADYSKGKISHHKDIMEGERFDSPMSPYFDNTEISWSPDGKTIAYTCKKMSGKDYALSTNSDIYLYNIETEETTNITEGMMGYDKYPIFSNDSKKISWHSMSTPGYESDKDRLFVYDFETKEKTYLTKDFDQNISNVIWSDDDKEIYFVSGYHATFQAYKININTKEVTQITKGTHNYNSIQRNAGVLIGTKMTMRMATEIFKIDEATGKETQLTFTNKNIYDKIEMGKVEERWVTTTDGKEMLVWVIYPPKFDKTKKYPALLYCQGGPQSAVSQFFSYRWNFQMMVTGDYIVVAPNRRGLPTFGSEWNAQISGDYGGQNMKDYTSAIDAVSKEPFVDENKLGAIGASYGGFSVYWLAGHNESKRFKVFIAHCGMFNLESQYMGTEEMFFVNHDLGGAFWEKDNKIAQNTYANSPHLFVDKWNAPIMMITGGYDFRIPYTESLQAFNAAQLNNVPSKLLYFPKESHFVLQPQNSILWQREFKGWLDKWLK